MDIIHAHLLLRRASFLASGDDTLAPVVKYHLALVEVQAFLLATDPDGWRVDDEPPYPLTVVGCIEAANRIVLHHAAEHPGAVSPDLLWGMTELLAEYREHEAALDDHRMQRLLHESE